VALCLLDLGARCLGSQKASVIELRRQLGFAHVRFESVSPLGGSDVDQGTGDLAVR